MSIRTRRTPFGGKYPLTLSKSNWQCFPKTFACGGISEQILFCWLALGPPTLNLFRPFLMASVNVRAYDFESNAPDNLSRNPSQIPNLSA